MQCNRPQWLCLLSTGFERPHDRRGNRKVLDSDALVAVLFHSFIEHRLTAHLWFARRCSGLFTVPGSCEAYTAQELGESPGDGVIARLAVRCLGRSRFPVFLPFRNLCNH